MSASRRIIGVDESGKGDFFGPLVVAALLADEDRTAELTAIGARDSKKIADRRLLQIDTELRRGFPHGVVIILPEEYNDRYEQVRNLNKLLAAGHARAIELVLAKSEADIAISDKFGKTELVELAMRERGHLLPVHQLVRGEAVPQVAAASVLARAAFIRQMQELSRLAGIRLPLGAAGQVDEAGRRVVAARGVDFLRKIAKTHFKNYSRVVNPRLDL